jgi:predicted RNase H-like HicB family nuclease
MSDTRRFTAMIYREKGGYVSFCPELDVASQGDSVEEASANLREAVELFLEAAAPSEVAARTREELYVAALRYTLGKLPMGWIARPERCSPVPAHRHRPRRLRGLHRCSLSAHK